MFEKAVNFIRTRKRLLVEAGIYVLAAIIIFSVAAGFRKPAQQVSNEPRVAGVQVSEINEMDTVTVQAKFNGELKASQSTVIRSTVQGTVQYLLPVGAQVSSGQQLYRLSNPSIEQSYFAALSAVADAQSSYTQTTISSDTTRNQSELALSQAEISLELARQGLSNAQRTADLNLRRARDNARVAYETAYATLESALRFFGGPNIDLYKYKDVISNNVTISKDIIDVFDKSRLGFPGLSRQAGDDVLTSLDEIERVLVDAHQLAQLSWTFLRLAVPGNGYSAQTLSQAVAEVDGYRQQLSGSNSQIKNERNSLASTIELNGITVDNARRQTELSEVSVKNARNALGAAETNAQLQKIGANSQVNGARSQLASIQYQYDNLALAAPFSGRIIAHNTSVGSQVNPGNDILEIGDLRAIEVRIEVSSSVAAAIRLGDNATINGKPVGRVSEIEAAADPATGKVGVTIEADNSSQEFVPGTIAEIELNLIYDPASKFVIPLKTVEVSQTGNIVLLLKDGEVEQRQVQLGQVYGDMVEVTLGLQAGDQLIVGNGGFLEPGDRAEAR